MQAKLSAGWLISWSNEQMEMGSEKPRDSVGF